MKDRRNNNGTRVSKVPAGAEGTETKRAEESLKLFRSLLDRSSDAIEVIDPDTLRFLDCNESACQCLGYSREEFLALSVFDIDSKIDESRAAAVAAEMKRSGFAIFESIHRRKDGSTFPVEVNVKEIQLGRAYRLAIVRDITERKRAENALREAGHKYREIFENAGEGIFQSTPDGRFISANPALARMHGFDSPEDLIRSRDDISRQIYVDPTRREEFKRLLEESDIVRGFECQTFRKDGSKTWISTNARAVRDEAGAIRYYEGTAQDINERKRAEARSVAFATLARKLSGARTPLDAGRIIAQTAADLFEWDSCNLDLYDAEHDLVHPMLNLDTIGGKRTDFTPFLSDRKPTARGKRVIDHGPELVLREEPVQFDEDSIPFGDTLRPSASIMSVPIRHASSIIGLLSIQSYTPRAYDPAALSDFQALADHCGAALNRIRAEEELRESEERFRQLSEAAFEAIILHDNGTILEVNQSFCRMYGYERAEVIGKSLLDLAPPGFRELLLQRVRSGGTGPFEGPFEGLALRKDGTIFRTEVAGKPIHYQGRPVRVAASRDITEQKRNERRQAAQYAVTRVLAESATLADAIPELLRVICESLRWKMGEFWRACDSTNLLRCVETWHVPALDATSFIEASRQTELAPGVGLPGRVWQSGQPAWIPDVTTDPGFARAAIAAKVGLRGAVAFPILMGNHTLGLMLFFSRRAPEVDEDLLKMMSAFGSQIGQFTERKHAEEAQLASESKYRDIFAFAPVGIYQSLRDGTLITANHTLAEMLGYASVDELLRVKLGRDVYLVADERERLIREHEVRGYPVDLELQWKTKDGSSIWVQLTAHAIKGANGATEYWEAFVRDITDRKRVEEALRESEERYRDLVENSREFICTHDLDGLILSANRAASEVLGYDLKDCCGKKNFRDLLVPEVRDQFDDYLTRIRRDGVASGLTLVQTSSGEPRILEYHNTLRTEGVATPIVRGMARDITEQRRAEKALRESEERYRDLVENSHELICTHDLEGKILSANRAATQLLGYEPHEFIGHGSIREILAPEVRHQFDEYMARVCKDGATSGIMLVQTSSGERRVWEYYNSLRTEGVATPIVRGMARDITEQRRAEKAMSDLSRELELTMNSMEEGVHRVDMQGNIAFENPAAARMLGWEVSELLGKPAHLTMHHTRQDGTPYPKEDCPIYTTLRDGVSRHGADEVFWRQDGTSFPVEFMTAPMRNDRNEIVATVVTFRDITARKRAEAALRESEERYRELFENAKDALYIHDLSGRYVSFNRAAEGLSGYSRDEILGKHYSNFVAPGHLKHARQSLCKKLDYEGETTYEIDLVTKDRRRVPVEVSSRLIYENGEPVGVQGVVRDITDRKRAQEVMRTYSQRLIEAQEAERQHIARELHDEIGQVLTAVRINLQSMQRSGGTNEDVLRLDESIGIVDEALGRVGELSIELRPSLLDDLGLTAALRWYVDRYAQRTGIIAEVLNGFEEDDRLPRDLETTCFRIAQEALTNAARHAKAASVSVQLERSRERILLTIIDDGVGFDVDQLRKGASAVVALGLRGMEERAVAVGGHIEIDSGLERGTRILATFPLRK
jgi:PAS domain S-box-containing protein